MNSEETSDPNTLCPFSKPIIGNWCRCPHAVLSERCSGKMVCTLEEESRDRCMALVELFREKARFVLGISGKEEELTHAQSMKIRCGGLLGMQRFMQMETETEPAVLDIIAEAEFRYGSYTEFPFSEIVRDIQNFSHRSKRRNG